MLPPDAIHPTVAEMLTDTLGMSPVATSALQQLVDGFDDELRQLQDQDLLRTPSTLQAIRGSEVQLDGRWLANWCSNDYLGLSTHPRLIRAAMEAAQRWGVGARASRLLAGSAQLHEQLEDALASFFHAEAALVFASGYLANLGVLSSLMGPDDIVFVDRLAHASLIDACRASRAMLRVFPHQDVTALEDSLQKRTRARRRFIVTEGLFSMDGDYAPLREFQDLAHRYEACLYVDDAHGAFALGVTGRGSPERADIPHGAFLYIGTLGKALGCQGGFVVGPRTLLRALQNRARTFIYSTALACPIVAAAHEALTLIQEEPAIRQRLANTTARCQQLLRTTLGFTQDPPSHIVSIVLGSSGQAREVSRHLYERGHFIPAIRPPTVPQGTARLRMSLTALHTEKHLQDLMAALQPYRNRIVRAVLT